MVSYSKSFNTGSGTINQNINIDATASKLLCSLTDSTGRSIFEVNKSSTAGADYELTIPKALVSSNPELRSALGIADADKDKDFVAKITNVTYVDAVKKDCGAFEGFTITLADGKKITSNAKGVKFISSATGATGATNETNINLGDNPKINLTQTFFKQALDSTDTSVSLQGKTSATKAAVDIASSNSLVKNFSPELLYNYMFSLGCSLDEFKEIKPGSTNSPMAFIGSVTGLYSGTSETNKNVLVFKDANGAFLWHNNKWNKIKPDQTTYHNTGKNSCFNFVTDEKKPHNINVQVTDAGGTNKKVFTTLNKMFSGDGGINKKTSRPNIEGRTELNDELGKPKTYELEPAEAKDKTPSTEAPPDKTDDGKDASKDKSDGPSTTKRDGSLFKALGGIGFIAALFLFVGAVMVPGAAAALVPAALGVLCASGALYVGSAIYEGNFSSELSSAIAKQKKNKKIRERFAKQVLKRDAKISRFKERLATLSPTSSEYARLNRKIKRYENFNDYNIQNAGPKFVDTLLKKTEEDFIKTYMEANDGKQPTAEEIEKSRLDFIVEHRYAIARNYIVNGYTKSSKRSLSKLSIAELALLDDAVQEIGTEIVAPTTTDADKVLGINLSMSSRHRGFAPDAASRTISNQDVRESTSNLINKLIKLKIKTDAIDKEETELDKKIEEEKQKVRTSGVRSSDLENNLDSQRDAAKSEISTEKTPLTGARGLTNEELKTRVKIKEKDAVEHFGRH